MRDLRRAEALCWRTQDGSCKDRCGRISTTAPRAYLYRVLAQHFERFLQVYDERLAPGVIGFIQTAGELLNFHPHLHLLITDGVLEPDGSFERLPYPDSRQHERTSGCSAPSCCACPWPGGLISQEIVDNLLSWRHSGFSLHADVRVPDRLSAARLGRAPPLEAVAAAEG